MNELPQEWSDAVKNLHLALRMCGLNFYPKHLDVILEVQKICLEKGDDVTLKDLAEIEADVVAKYKTTSLTE